MKNKIVSFSKLNKNDYWTVGLYSFLTIYIFLIIDLNPKIIFAYSILTQIGLYTFYYKALRNFTFYLIWLFFGILHWLISEYFQKSMVNSNFEYIFNTLKNTFPLLVIFLILRVISLLVQNKELVSPQSTSFKDINDSRYVNLIDYLLFFIYLIILISLTI